MKTHSIKMLALMLVAGFVLFQGCTTAKTAKTAETLKEDTSWMYHDIVDMAFVKAHIGPPVPRSVMLIDARPYKTKYVYGYIPGAVSIPFSEFDQKVNLLPEDKNTLLIYYCEGEACKLSHKSAFKAEALGYKNVKVYPKGYPEWKEHYPTAAIAQPVKSGNVEGAIDIDQFTAIIENRPEDILLVDVRDPDEFAKGSFNTAVNIPVEDLESKIKDFPDNKPIVYVCSTGARSGEAYYMTKDVRQSLKEVYYVEAGIDFKGPGRYEIKKPK